MNQDFRKKSQRSLQAVASMVENILSWAVLAGLVACGYCLFKKYLYSPSLFSAPDGLQNFLADVLVLVIGVEFIKTLINHTPETIMEILLFTVTRHVVLNHGNMIETLAGCVSIILLLAAHRYLGFIKIKAKNDSSPEVLVDTSEEMSPSA